MANSVTIQRTIFQSIDEKGNQLNTTYGFRIYDDHAAAYDNFIPTLDDLNKLTAEDLIQRAEELNDTARGLIDFARMNDEPIIVDDQEVRVGGLTP